MHDVPIYRRALPVPAAYHVRAKFDGPPTASDLRQWDGRGCMERVSREIQYSTSAGILRIDRGRRVALQRGRRAWIDWACSSVSEAQVFAGAGALRRGAMRAGTG